MKGPAMDRDASVLPYTGCVCVHAAPCWLIMKQPSGRHRRCTSLVSLVGLAPQGLALGSLGSRLGCSPHLSGETGQMSGVPFMVIFILLGKPWEHMDKSISSVCERSRHGAEGYTVCQALLWVVGWGLRQTEELRCSCLILVWEARWLSAVGSPLQGASPAWDSVAFLAVNARLGAACGLLSPVPPRSLQIKKHLPAPFSETRPLKGSDRNYLLAHVETNYRLSQPLDKKMGCGATLKGLEKICGLRTDNSVTRRGGKTDHIAIFWWAAWNNTASKIEGDMLEAAG